MPLDSTARAVVHLEEDWTAVGKPGHEPELGLPECARDVFIRSRNDASWYGADAFPAADLDESGSHPEDPSTPGSGRRNSVPCPREPAGDPPRQRLLQPDTFMLESKQVAPERLDLGRERIAE